MIHGNINADVDMALAEDRDSSTFDDTKKVRQPNLMSALQFIYQNSQYTYKEPVRFVP